MDILATLAKGVAPEDILNTSALDVNEAYKVGSYHIAGADAWVEYFLAQADDKVLGYIVL